MTDYKMVPVELLNRVTEDMALFLEDAGGCDHSVGICFCGPLNDLATLKTISAAPPQDNWLPIESAPRDGTEILTINMRQGGVKRLISWDRIYNIWRDKGAGIFSMQDTHWQPLPKPPQIIPGTTEAQS